MVSCEHCKKTIVAVGNRRKNGKPSKKDWLGRKYHSKCYKDVQDRIALLQKHENYINFD